MRFQDTQEKLFKKGIITVRGATDSDMYHDVEKGLSICEAEGFKEVNLRIRSGGGSVVVGLDIYDLLNDSPLRIDGRVMSYAASMGAIILQACDKRSMGSNSYLLVHDVRMYVRLYDLQSDKKLKKIIKEAADTQQRLEEIISVRTGRPISDFSKYMRSDREIPPDECLRLGLIDEVTPLKASKSS